MIKLALALAFSCMGCVVGGLPNVYQVRLDPSLTNEESQWVTDAVKDWKANLLDGFDYYTQVSSDRCGYDMLSNQGCTHILFTSQEEVTAKCGANSEPRGSILGCNIPDDLRPGTQSNILVERASGWDGASDPESIWSHNHQMLLHEFGHAWGLRHDIAGTVMAVPDNTAYVVITSRDILQYRRLHQ